MNYPHITLAEAILLPKDKSVIFYWMPKCAGTSIRDAFLRAFGSNFLECDNGNPIKFDPSAKYVTFYHRHVPALVDDGFVTQEWIDNAFGFAFVRDPWDRMVSLFQYLGRINGGAGLLGLPKVFADFLAIVVAGDYPMPDSRGGPGYGQANSLLSWLRPDGVWLPHFVGKMEKIQEEWDILSKILGLKYPLPHNNRNPILCPNYRDSYTRQTRELIAKHFAEEIEIFGYTFE